MRLIPTVLLVLLLAISSQGFAKDSTPVETVLPSHPGGDLWRDVRNSDVAESAVSQVKGVDSNVLIHSLGDQWARLRMTLIVEVAAYGLIATILVLLAVYALKGRTQVTNGLSGQKVLRFSDYQRVLHWLVASVFLYLAVTGLVLLLGREFLIPILGKELFSVVASASKESHNLFGPIFSLSLLLMLFEFGRKNIYEKGDVKWLLRTLVASRSHASSGFFNFGEKIWFWLLIIIGLVISASGFVLVLQNFDQGRLIMELSQLVHVSSALLLIAVSFGHIYMGSVGTDATAEGMKSGYVDLNWAKMHHDRWAQHCVDNNAVIANDENRQIQEGVN